MTSQADPELVRLRRLLAHVELRAKWCEIGSKLADWAPLQLGAACVWIGAAWFLRPGWATAASTRWLALVAIGATPSMWAILGTFRRKTPKFAIGLAVDRALGSADLVASALCFAERRDRTPLEQLVVERAVQRCHGLDAGKIVPFRGSPRPWAVLGCVVTMGLLVPTARRGPDPSKTQQAASNDPQTRSALPVADELRQIRAILAELKPMVGTPAAVTEMERLERLVTAFAQGQLDRDGLLHELSREAQGKFGDFSAISTEFSGWARTLSGHSSTTALARALAEGRMSDAKLALEALETRWREPRKGSSAEELAALRKAVDAERANRQNRLATLQEERVRVLDEREHLQRRAGSRQATGTDTQRIDELSRRLEYLERQKSAADRAEPAISALDRAISQASRALAAELGLERDSAWDGFAAAARELDQLDRSQRTEAEKREILAKIQQIREILRAQGQQSANRVVALQRFRQRAEGPSQSARTHTDAESSVAGAQPDPSGRSLLLEPVPTPIQVNVPGSETASRSSGGPSTGNRHQAVIRGAAEKATSQPTKDALAATVDRGSGTVSPEVVATAAQRGFAARDYQAVFRAYVSVAETLLGQPELPAPDREQVLRYYQLIEPRENPE